MRVLVVSALAATLVGCSSLTPQQAPIHTAAKAKIIVGMQRRPRKPAINATKVELHSSDLDAGSAAERAKGIISAKLGNPASIKIPEPWKVIDSFCGVAEVKGASGEEEREMPFVYLVQRNEVYIINGSDDLRAATAIHIMCDR